MRFRLTLAALLLGAGLASAEPPKPAVVVQVKPVSRVLGEVREMVRQVGGPAEGDRLVKGFDQGLKDALGEEGFEGLDINRPIAVYVVAKEKAEDCRLVLVVPVTGEKEFVGFLGRIKVKAEAVKDKKGVYALELPEDLFSKESHLQFTDAGWAYITLNDGDPTDPKEFVAVGDLLDNVDQSLFSAKLFPPRVPAKLAAELFDQVDQAADQMKAVAGFIDEKHWAKVLTTFCDQWPKLFRRYGETVLKDATEGGLTFSFDQTTGETVTELTLVPKAGTGLAKEVAAWGKTSNRFAGVVTKDAAFGVTLKVPVFAKELREIGTVLVDALAEEVKKTDLPTKLKAVAEEAGKGLGRAVGAGTLDAAVALHGPDKDGKFALVIGLSFDDPTELEKALRLAAKDPEFAKEMQLDAAKVGDVAVHKVPLARLIPEDAKGEFETVFGENPAGYVAFTKDAVFLGFGAGSLEHVKTALGAKPGPAPMLDVTGNMKKLQKLVAALDPKAGEMFAKHLGLEDKPANWLRVTVEGGDKLTAKVSLNVRYIPKLLFASELEVAPPR